MTEHQDPYRPEGQHNPEEIPHDADFDAGSHEEPHDQQAYDQQAYPEQAYDQQAYDQQAYDQQGYQEQAYDQQQYDQQGYAEQPYDQQAYGDPAYDQGGYADPAAGGAVEPPPLEPAIAYGARDSLEEMYIQKDKVEHSPLTIREGMPTEDVDEEPGRGVGPIVVGMILFFLVLICSSALFLVKRPIVAENGLEERVSLGQWLWLQVSMSPAQRHMQELTPDQRAYVVTARRIYPVQNAVLDWYGTRGSAPRIYELADEGLIAEDFQTDGWQNEFIISLANGRFTIISCGVDGIPRNSDDISLTDSLFKAPPEFENIDYELSVTAE